jgi:hypothetical protein
MNLTQIFQAVSASTLNARSSLHKRWRRRGLAALVLANALPIAACVPGDISYDGTETSGSETASTLETDTDSDATSTLGDGDGDPGDGDGDTCESTAAIECDDLNRCWAQDADWPAWAQWADPVDVQNGVDAGTLTPVDIAGQQRRSV